MAVCCRAIARSPIRSTSTSPATIAASATSEATAGQIHGRRRMSSGHLGEAIAGAADGMQQRPVEPLVDLLAQAADVGVDQAGVRIEPVVPQLLQHHGAGDDAVLV